MSRQDTPCSVTRRDVLRWGLSALASPALLASPQSRSGLKDRAIFLRPGDHLSEPQMLRRRLESGHTLRSDMASNALRWRLLGDRTAAAEALHAVLATNPGRASSRTWPVYAQFALAADWLRTFRDFSLDQRRQIAALLRETAAGALRSPELATPAQTSYQNYSTRFLALGVFTATAAAHLEPGHSELAVLQSQLAIADRNVTFLAQMVTPDGGSHESMDYTRISLMPMAMLAELYRTVLGQDPAGDHSYFSSFGAHYVYKLLPDGSPSREGDNEYPLLDGRDVVALGYAVNRFRDQQAAHLLREGPARGVSWGVPVLQFLWDDPRVRAVNPQEAGLPHARHFRGVDQAVFRSGFTAEDTRIEFDCGPYFAKHQHLDRGHFTIHHRGHLAIDSGADYTDCESPHYLNYYRRTVAHNTLLVYDPGEIFFWSEDVLRAANDGGQRMDSSRYWNTVRGKTDWERTRDIWDLGHIEAFDTRSREYCYTRGNATRAYSAAKLSHFTRELVYFPADDLLAVFDTVATTRPELRKTWLLHTVDEPRFLPSDNIQYDRPHGGKSMPADGSAIWIIHGDGELTVHPIFPAQRNVLKRGGQRHEFWTPGDAQGGDWGTGRNWPQDPPTGGPLPANEDDRAMWHAFYGKDFNRILPSNQVNVIPGSWRLELSPVVAELEDHFLVLMEIGAKGTTGKLPVIPIESASIKGVARGTLAICFVTAPHGQSIEFTTPSQPLETLWLGGLPSHAVAVLDLTGSNLSMTSPLPGVSVSSHRMRANEHGVALLKAALPANCRARIHFV